MPYKSFLLLALAAGSLLMGKPAPPVKISGSMGASSGSVNITFEKAADLVEVQVWGTDGLVVHGNKIQVTNQKFEAGKTLNLKVDYTPGTGHSNLVVSVKGQFGESKGSHIISFTVGDKAPPSRHTTVTDDSGQRIIEMRGNRKQ